MLTKKPWLTLSIISLFFLVLGILIETCVKDWPLLKIKPEVDVFAAISTIVTAIVTGAVTLIVAYWVTTVLEKRNSDNRTEKDIIIKHIDVIFAIIEQVRSKVQDGVINYTLAGSSVKRINMNTSAIIKAIDETSITLTDPHEQPIIMQANHIKDLLTRSNDPELTVNDGKISLSSDRQILIDAELDKLRMAVFKLELKINKG